jgi:hypothetical protein
MKQFESKIVKNGETFMLGGQPFLNLEIEEGADVTIVDDFDVFSGEPVREISVEIGCTC